MGKSFPVRQALSGAPPSSTGLADALFSRTQQKVLGILFGRPERSFYASEVIGLAAAGSGAVQRELARLEQVGLVNVTRIGNQKHYQANPASPVFEELAGIARKTFALAEPLRTALKPVWKRIDVAFVYGSIAKGSDTARSDVDLFVLSDALTYPDLIRALDRVRGQLGREVNPTLMSSAELKSMLDEGNAFATRVVEQPKIWIKGSIDDLPTRGARRSG